MSDSAPVVSTPTSTPSSSEPSTKGLGNNSPNSHSAESQGQHNQTEMSSATKTKTFAESSAETFDVKVDGKIVKMTRQEVLDYASMAKHANSKFEEAARLRKEYESKKELYSKDPLRAFLDHAEKLSPEARRKAIEDYYAKEYIEPETLNEDQKKARDLEARLKQYEEAEAAKKAEEEKRQEDDLTNKQREYLQSQIIEAMDASGLPKTKFFVSRMAFYMRQNMLNGWEAPVSMIVKQVQNERQSIMSDLSEGASAEQLISLLGDGVINKIRSHDLNQLRQRRAQVSSPPVTSQNAGTGPIGGREKVSSAEVNKRLRDMRRGIF